MTLTRAFSTDVWGLKAKVEERWVWEGEAAERVLTSRPFAGGQDKETEGLEGNVRPRKALFLEGVN